MILGPRFLIRRPQYATISTCDRLATDLANREVAQTTARSAANETLPAVRADFRSTEPDADESTRSTAFCERECHWDHAIQESQRMIAYNGIPIGRFGLFQSSDYNFIDKIHRPSDMQNVWLRFTIDSPLTISCSNLLLIKSHFQKVRCPSFYVPFVIARLLRPHHGSFLLTGKKLHLFFTTPRYRKCQEETDPDNHQLLQVEKLSIHSSGVFLCINSIVFRAKPLLRGSQPVCPSWANQWTIRLPTPVRSSTGEIYTLQLS